MEKLILAVVIFAGCMVAARALKKVLAARPKNQLGEDRAANFDLAKRALLIVGIALPALIVLLSSFRVIPAGHVGVATLFGSVQPQPLSEGLNMVNPLLSITKMSVQVQKYQTKYDAASADMQVVHVEQALNYRLLPDKSPWVFRNIGVNYASVIIDPAAQEILKANTAQHVALEILKQRPKIKDDVQQGITSWLAKYGIETKEVALANIRFDPAYEKAIEEKQIQEQVAEKKKYELLQAQKNAEIAIANAKGRGDASREKAKGEADATRTRGEADAAYNAKVSTSLTPLLVQNRYVSQWDGQLPQYMLGGGSGVLLQLPGGDARK